MHSSTLRRSLRSVLLLTGIVAFPASASAQINASERATFTQVISGTEVEIDYARPSVRNRGEPFGDVVPMPEVWTPGANDATTLRISKPVHLNGVEIPAGKYSLWIDVQDGPWTLVVHEDTTLFHTQHPQVEDGLAAIPIERTLGPEFYETLTFEIGSVRPDRATLNLKWGYDRVVVEMGIDPGVVLTVEPDAAARYVGEWMLDDSESAPTDEEIDEFLADPDMPPEGIVYFTQLREMERPRSVTIQYDPETSRLYLIDRWEAEMMRAAIGGDEDDDRTSILLLKADGIFFPAFMMYGDLGGFNEEYESLMEFEFDDSGRAVRWVTRSPADEVVARGERAGG